MTEEPCPSCQFYQQHARIEHEKLQRARKALKPFADYHARIVREGDKPIRLLVPFDWLEAAAVVIFGEVTDE